MYWETKFKTCSQFFFQGYVLIFHVQRNGLETRYFEFVMEGGGGAGGGGGDNTCEPQFWIKLSKVCEINVTRQQVS